MAGQESAEEPTVEIEVRREGEMWIAEVAALDSVVAYGQTEDEAIYEAARQAAVEMIKRQGRKSESCLA